MFNAEDMIKFAGMKVVDLKAELKKRGIKGYNKMKKAELQEKVISIWEAEAEAEVQATDVVNAVPLNAVPVEEVNVVPLNVVPLNVVPLNVVPLNAVPLNAFPVEEVQATDVVNAEEVNELKYRIEELEYELDQRDEEIAELSQLSHYINTNKSFTKKMIKDLARIYHPDKCGNTEDMIKLNEFKEAFKV